jgi:hypothetical protein
MRARRRAQPDAGAALTLLACCCRVPATSSVSCARPARAAAVMAGSSASVCSTSHTPTGAHLLPARSHPNCVLLSLPHHSSHTHLANSGAEACSAEAEAARRLPWAQPSPPPPAAVGAADCRRAWSRFRPYTSLDTPALASLRAWVQVCGGARVFTPTASCSTHNSLQCCKLHAAHQRCGSVCACHGQFDAAAAAHRRCQLQCPYAE